MNYKKLTILIDLDSITADLQTPWYARYNKDWQDNITPEDILTWDTHLHVKPECGKRIYGYFNSHLFKSLEPTEGSQETIRKWYDAGHEIVFVTATPWACADAKYEWVHQHFSFLTYHDVIMAHKKHLVSGDVLIDDSPKNIRKHRETHGTSVALLTIAYPYNKEVESLLDVRAGSWNDTESAWKAFDKFINKLAKDKYVEPIIPEPTD
jgi:5'-nucleotidase